MATIKTKKTILHLTPFFAPNIGGVETHLSDLTTELGNLSYKNIILTYSPITTDNVDWKNHENITPNIYVRRFSWFGHNLFHTLEKHPLINFLYITPYLLFRSIIWLSIHRPQIDVVHSHGVNGAFISIIIKYLFHINNHIVSIYSSYDNVPLNNLSTKLMVYILNHTDQVLTQSDKSVSDLTKLGVNPHKLSRYRHWINLQQFKPIDNNAPLRKSYGLPNRFTLLFVGRLIPQKNALLLADIAAKFPDINFVFVGSGPDYQTLLKQSKINKNIYLLGNIPYQNLHHCYQSADIFCLPSKYEEGWGRVLMESIACGVPVISSNLGATVEAVDTTVAVFITPEAPDLIKAIKKLQTDKKFYNQLKTNCRPFALKHFSTKNINFITRHY